MSIDAKGLAYIRRCFHQAYERAVTYGEELHVFYGPDGIEWTQARTEKARLRVRAQLDSMQSEDFILLARITPRGVGASIKWARKTLKQTILGERK